MKCVQVVGQGIPIRLSDDDAHYLVSIGDGQFCPKHKWRKYLKDHGEHALTSLGPINRPVKTRRKKRAK